MIGINDPVPPRKFIWPVQKSESKNSILKEKSQAGLSDLSKSQGHSEAVESVVSLQAFG